ncbi:MAG TPA: hypothetical protein PKM88_09830 [bacterium]|nr:hypothetical protein [bacterium]
MADPAPSPRSHPLVTLLLAAGILLAVVFSCAFYTMRLHLVDFAGTAARDRLGPLGKYPEAGALNDLQYVELYGFYQDRNAWFRCTCSPEIYRALLTRLATDNRGSDPPDSGVVVSRRSTMSNRQAIFIGDVEYTAQLVDDFPPHPAWWNNPALLGRQAFRVVLLHSPTDRRSHMYHLFYDATAHDLRAEYNRF